MERKENFSLETLSSFHSKGVAQEYVNISSEEELISFLPELKNKKYYLLGKGYNTLFNGDFSGIILQNKILWIEVIEENDEDIILKVGWGEDWVDFVKYCVHNHYAGIENLSEIPGTVGAAPVQNIGAYGAEVADVVVAVEWIMLDSGEKKIFSREDCSFGYRESIFKDETSGLKNNFLISYVIVILKKYNTEKKNKKENYQLNMEYADIQNYISEYGLSQEDLWISEISEIITTIRQGKLPNLEERGTAGSFFKNPIILEQQYSKLLEAFPMLKSYPVADNNADSSEKKVKIPAAQLIELVGLKGVLEDWVGTYKNHALILVSQWVQDGRKIVDFSKKIQEKVKNTFDVILEPEVNIIWNA